MSFQPSLHVSTRQHLPRLMIVSAVPSLSNTPGQQDRDFAVKRKCQVTEILRPHICNTSQVTSKHMTLDCSRFDKKFHVLDRGRNNWYILPKLVSFLWPSFVQGPSFLSKVKTLLQHYRHTGEHKSGNQIRILIQELSITFFLIHQSVLAIPNVRNCNHATFSKFPDLHFTKLGTHSFHYVHFSCQMLPGCAHDRLPSRHSPIPRANLSFTRRLNSLSSFGT